MPNDQSNPKLGFRVWLGIGVWSLGFILVGFFFYEFFREKPAAAKVITIQSRNLAFQVATTAKTVGEVLAEQGINSDSNDSNLHANVANSRHSSVIRELESRLISGMTIDIRKPLSIILVDGGSERQVTTTAATVNDLLYEQKLGLAATDRVTPPLGSFLGEATKVTIDRIVDLEVTEAEEIPFEIYLQHDPEIYYGREEVIRPGVPGQKEQQFLITYKNGVEIRRKLLKSRVLGKPVVEVRKFGTKIEVEEEREGRASWYAYKKCLCAAHPFYDIGRYAIVTRLDTGKSIIVQINDRGPELDKHPERVIDLDSTAFKELAPLGSGTIGVRVELLR